MTTGPLLYDDDPMPLHTGTPRRRHALLLGIGAATVAVAVLMVVLLRVMSGSATDRAEQVGGVFVAALSQGDTETAYALLCPSERSRLQPGDLAGAYLHEGTPQVTGSRDGGGGQTARLVDVRWGTGATATTTALVVVPQDGAKVCGTQPG